MTGVRRGYGRSASISRSSLRPHMAPLHEGLGQIEQQRFGPLEIVDRERHRLRRRERSEEPADQKNVSSGVAGVPARTAATPATIRVRSVSVAGITAASAARWAAPLGVSSRPRTARSASASGANVAPPAASQGGGHSRARPHVRSRTLAPPSPRLARPLSRMAFGYVRRRW